MSGAMKEMVSTFSRYLILLTKIHSTLSLPKQQKHKRGKKKHYKTITTASHKWANNNVQHTKKEYNNEMKWNDVEEHRKNK